MLHDPLRLLAGIRREPREHGRMRLRIAPFKDPGLVGHAGQEHLKLVEAHGAVFHVEVHTKSMSGSRASERAFCSEKSDVLTPKTCLPSESFSMTGLRCR